MPFINGQFRDLPAVYVTLSDGTLRLPEYYVQALRQDSEKFDQLFSAKEPVQVPELSMSDFELFLYYLYQKAEKPRHFRRFTLNEKFVIAKIASQFDVKPVLLNLKAELEKMTFTSVAGIEYAHLLFTLLTDETDDEKRKELCHYFSACVSDEQEGERARALVEAMPTLSVNIL